RQHRFLLRRHLGLAWHKPPDLARSRRRIAILSRRADSLKGRLCLPKLHPCKNLSISGGRRKFTFRRLGRLSEASANDPHGDTGCFAAKRNRSNLERVRKERVTPSYRGHIKLDWVWMARPLRSRHFRP